MKGGTVPKGYLWAAASGDTAADFGIKSDAKAPDGGISVEAFKIGKTEVRYELWYIVKEWGEGHGYTFKKKGRAGKSGGEGTFPVSPDKDEPVTTVGWRDVVVWCNAYSEITGKEPVYYADSAGTTLLKDATATSTVNGAKKLDRNGYRLPTEAEWEYAARGGVPSDAIGSAWTYTYAGSNSAAAVAWYNIDTDTIHTTNPVGQKAANSAGLCDMSGNVYEWCFDSCYSGERRVMRGGSWGHPQDGCLVAYRRSDSPSKADDGLGFRVVCR
jgi:formylglycine-generating enzyme required for sulfatase activity